MKASKLQMPKQSATLFVYSSSKEDYNDTTGEVKKSYLLFVVYIPYATPQSIGLALETRGSRNAWMIDTRTHTAHIMINPPPAK